MKMDDLVVQVGAGKFDQPDVNNPLDQDGAGMDEEPKILIKNPDHPVGEVEIQPPKVNGGDKEVDSLDEEEKVYSTDQLQFLMGLSLAGGFVFMLVIDQCGGGHSHAHMPDNDIINGTGRHRRKNMTATIGLVVHAAGK